MWPGTIIRGDHHKIVLGAYVDIQDNCVVHTDSDAVYGDYVTLGHHVICHAKTVEHEHPDRQRAPSVNGEVRHRGVLDRGRGLGGPRQRRDPGRARSSSARRRRCDARREERHHQMARGVAQGYARNGQDFKEAGLGDVPEEFLMADATTDVPPPPERS